MKLDLEKIMEVIFPLSEDERRISNCEASTFVLKLDMQKQGAIEGLARFKDQEIRSALHLVKFHNNKKAALLLSALLKQKLITLPYEEHLLIPIPLSTQRFRQRGHNQVSTIAKGALKELPHMVLATDILIKTRNTKPQTTLNRNERQSNILGAFSMQRGGIPQVEGKNIILLDDVTTTGATLKEALAVIQECRPRSVRCIALAY